MGGVVTIGERLGPGREVPVSNELPFVLFAGPCQIEDREHALRHAAALVEMCRRAGVPLVYKSSFDKANRTSGTSARGVGLDEGLRILDDVSNSFALPVMTDVHTVAEVRAAADFVDVLQIPALLSRQTDLIRAAAATGQPINIKKGQFSAPADMQFAVDKAGDRSGVPGCVLLTERGTTFGHHDIVVDMRGIVIMRAFAPVIFDATHSVQRPGLASGASGGERRFVAPLARAAVAVGVAGVFIECHADPDNAPSDGPCMLDMESMPDLIRQLKSIDQLVKP